MMLFHAPAVISLALAPVVWVSQSFFESVLLVGIALVGGGLIPHVLSHLLIDWGGDIDIYSECCSLLL
jgi:uncharacterized membrane protein YgdD (TMEM256/DUF423 family)